ncbi:MAG: penicillin-binding protein 2 [Pseudomonadota bacterium]
MYPQGALTAHITGYTDIDNKGLAGLERSFDEALTDLQEPLELTLDVRAQHVVREELANAMRYFSAIGGVGIVLDARTGGVVALVSLPDFEPSEPGKSPDAARFNRATLGLYEMGSTLKILTTAMALETGVTSLTGGYDATDPIRFGRFTINDYKGKHRWLSVPEIFKYSSNIGMAKMALDVGTDRQQAFLDSVGILRTASIELEEVGAPLVPDPWREINTITISYGHGLAISPLQTASAVAAIVNGGIYHKASLIKHPDGVNPIGQRVIRPEVAEAMKKLLRLVVTEGTGRHADAEGYLVGGKTGSAEKQKSGGYSDTALVSSFVGAFPMTDPRYVVFAMLDEPKGREETRGYATGGWVAAPVVSKIVRRLAPLLGVAPVNPLDPAVQAYFALPDAGPPVDPALLGEGAVAGNTGGSVGAFQAQPLGSGGRSSVAAQ